jgi:hypothetical protein
MSRNFEKLERHVAGDLEPTLAAEVEAGAQRDPRLAAWLEERRANADAFLVDPRRRSFAALVADAESSPARQWLRLRLRLILPGALLATAAAAALLVALDEPDRSARVRARGGVNVEAAVLRAGHSEVVTSGAVLRPGDRLRLSVDDARGGYLAVLLQEESGATSVVYGVAELGRIAAGRHVLPDSLELDARLGRERLFVLLADEEPDLDLAIRELRAAFLRQGFEHDWLPPAGVRLTTVSYTKVAP